jgi:hypothetical protein
MTAKPIDSSPRKMGREQTTEAMLGLQNELLEGYQQTSRAWLARVKSEIELWSELATKLAATRSAPEAMEIYQQCIAQRTQMAAEDWQRLSEDFQRFTQTTTRSPSNGRSLGGT